MKTIYILFILTIFSFSCASSQEVKKIKIGSTTYNYETTKGRLYSGNNVLKAENEKLKCPSFIISQFEDLPFNDIIKSVFTKERRNEFAKNNKSFSLVLIINPNGLIQEVTFLLSGMDISKNGGSTSLSHNEISLLEKKLKQYKFKLENPCDDLKQYTFTMPVRFNKIK